MTPALSTLCDSLKGMAATLPAARGSLPPGRALRLRPGKAGSLAPAGEGVGPSRSGVAGSSLGRPCAAGRL